MSDGAGKDMTGSEVGRVGDGRGGAMARPGQGRRRGFAGRAAMLGLPLVLALAGCTPSGFPPACPQLALIKGAADQVKVAPNGKVNDIRSLVLAARIQAVPASCRFVGEHGVGAEVRVQFAVQRGPTVTNPDIELHYFVAAARGQTILDEQDYVVKGAFPPNVDRMTLTSEPVELEFPVGDNQSAAGYQIYVGFRLSKEELARNRAQGL